MPPGPRWTHDRRDSARMAASATATRAGPILAVLARRVHAIREEHNVQVVLRIDPERRAGEAGVSERGRRQEVPARAVAAPACPSRARGSRTWSPARW